MSLVHCKVEVCLRHLNQVCKGEHGILNGMNFDGEEWKICRYCVDDIDGEGRGE